MQTRDGRPERYVLEPHGRTGKVRISRQVQEFDFEPPIWVEHELFGPFKNRETARQFMVKRQKAQAADLKRGEQR